MQGFLRIRTDGIRRVLCSPDTSSFKCRLQIITVSGTEIFSKLVFYNWWQHYLAHWGGATGVQLV